MIQAYMSPRTFVPDTHFSPTHTCIRHTHVSDTHLHPTHTCTRHTHASEHTCTQHTLAPNTHLHPTHTCTRHTLAPDTHMYPTHTSKIFKKVQKFLQKLYIRSAIENQINLAAFFLSRSRRFCTVLKFYLYIWVEF